MGPTPMANAGGGPGGGSGMGPRTAAEAPGGGAVGSCGLHQTSCTTHSSWNPTVSSLTGRCSASSLSRARAAPRLEPSTLRRISQAGRSAPVPSSMLREMSSLSTVTRRVSVTPKTGGRPARATVGGPFSTHWPSLW